MRKDIIAIGIIVTIIGSIFFIIGSSHKPTYSLFYDQTDYEFYNTLELFGIIILITGIIILIMGFVSKTKRLLPSQSVYQYPYKQPTGQQIRFCAKCNRQIPFDSNLCSFCGQSNPK